MHLTNEHIYLCGGYPSPYSDSVITTQLNIHENIKFEIAQFTNNLLRSIPDRVLDLLDIASYVYAADQLTKRGGDAFAYNGKKWRRHFNFYISLREPSFWSQASTINSLKDCLTFMTEDEYSFTFKQLLNPDPSQKYLNLTSRERHGFTPNRVVLFSGGLDSLAGAIDEGVVNNNKVLLITHSSTNKLKKTQNQVFDKLNKRHPNTYFHIPIFLSKKMKTSSEHTQRCRSFLFSVLAYAVAQSHDINEIYFYENGVVSINLPISDQVIGSRASRTTHPVSLYKMEKLLSHVHNGNFSIKAPYLFKTKGDIIRIIKDNGFGNVIHKSNSCAHVWERTNKTPHCGTCSQCIDRRFASLASGCTDDEDPEDDYEINILVGALAKPEHQQMANGLVHRARMLLTISSTDCFFQTYSELHTLFHNLPIPDKEEYLDKLLDLHHRHAQEVLKAIEYGHKRYAKELAYQSLPMNCLLQTNSRELSTDDRSAIELELLASDLPKIGDTAKIIGHNEYNGTHKVLGVRGLFAAHSLFSSKETMKLGAHTATCISASQLKTILHHWLDSNAFKGRVSVSGIVSLFIEQVEKSPYKGLFSYQKKIGRGNADKHLSVLVEPEFLSNKIYDPISLVKPFNNNP